MQLKSNDPEDLRCQSEAMKKNDLENTLNHNMTCQIGNIYSGMNAKELAERRREPRRETNCDRLELNSNKWKLKRNIIVDKKCNCRTCPKCGRKRGFETRKILTNPEILKLFSNPALITFTIDRSKFESPKQSHEVITEGGYIRRLLRLLGINIWVWVLEFQKAGWPHWHIIINGKINPKQLKRIWKLWREDWKLGGVDIQRRRNNFENAIHAMNYITKYLTSSTKNEFPEWFLNGSRKRLCQASKIVGRLTNRKKESSRQIISLQKKRQPAKSLIIRMSECGKESYLLEETIDEKNYKSTYKYIGKLSIGVNDIKKIVCEEGYLSKVLKWTEILRWGYTTIGLICLIPNKYNYTKEKRTGLMRTPKEYVAELEEKLIEVRDFIKVA